MLRVENLHVFYGGIHALQGVSLEVPLGKIVTLIGANGAGKSTTLRAISGLVKASEGRVFLNDQDVTTLPTAEKVKRGITMVPEGRKIFPNLTVLENLKLGAYARKNSGEVKEDLQMVMEIFPRLREREWQAGGTLSGGEQQMLAVGRALMSRPQVLMMDEPSLGLAPLIVQEIFRIIRKLNQEGMTILLIEQNAHAALEVADYAYVLETGKIVLEGTGQAVASDEQVSKAYLGG